MTASRTSTKHAGKKSRAAARPRIEYRDVLRALTRDELRSRVLARFKSAGGNPDTFLTSRACQLAMAEALTAAEDWMEIGHPKWEAERAAVRDVRRKLEV